MNGRNKNTLKSYLIKQLIFYSSVKFSQMPVVHSIDAIKIKLYFFDHLPPHFHAEYNEYEVLIIIDTLEVYAGSLPRREMRKVLSWAAGNQDYLTEKWAEFHP